MTCSSLFKYFATSVCFQTSFYGFRLILNHIKRLIVSLIPLLSVSANMFKSSFETKYRLCS